jgi:Lysine methyltransferase
MGAVHNTTSKNLVVFLIRCRRFAVTILVLLAATIIIHPVAVHSLSAPSSLIIQKTRKSTLYSKDDHVVIGSLVEYRHSEKRIHEVSVWANDRQQNDSPPVVSVTLPYVDRPDSVGSSLWPSSMAGAILYCNSPTLQSAMQDKNLLEVGSGLGLGGLVVAATVCGGGRPPNSCVLTDNDPDLVERLEQHIIDTTLIKNKNDAACALSVHRLDWRDSSCLAGDDKKEPMYDVCMGFDVGYYYHLITSLVTTLRVNLKPKNARLLVIGQCNRKSQWHLYHYLKEGGYNQITDEQELPWPGTTRMMLYSLETEEWTDNTHTDDDISIRGRLEGSLPIAALYYTTSDLELDSLTAHDHEATKDDEEAQLMSF